MKKLIVCNMSKKYFQGFDKNGSISFTGNVNKAIDLNSLNEIHTSSRAIITRMLCSWYNKKSWTLCNLSIKTVEA